MPLRSLRSIVAGRPPVTAASITTVVEAARTMKHANVGALLVVDHGLLIGIFTERDAALKLAGSAGAGRDLAATPISEVMTGDPVVLRSTDSIAVAVQKMAVGGFRHIPLVRDGQPVGVISAADIFRHILRIVE